MSKREGGSIDVVLRVPDDKAVDDIRDPFLRAQVADALDTGEDPQKLLVLERELLKLRYKKAAAAIGKKARQLRFVDREEKTIVRSVLMGNLDAARTVQRLVEP